MLPLMVLLVLSHNEGEAKVTVTGCPVAGVEGGCVTLAEKDGKVYNISAAEPKPRIGHKAIKLTGKPSRAMTTCMQGTPLEEISWKYTRKKCPKPAAEKQ